MDANERIAGDVPTEHTSWTRIEQGDVDYVVKRYWTPVYRFLRARLGDTDDAEEATQEFFLRFIEKDVVARLDRKRGTCRSFIYHLARQFLIDLLRARQAEKRRNGLELEFPDDLEGDSRRPQDEFDEQWFRSLLNSARRSVKAHYMGRNRPEVYQAFRLFYFGDAGPERWSRSRVSVALGVPVTTIDNHLHRARAVYAQALRVLISEYCAPEDVDAELAELGAFLSRHRGEDAQLSTLLMTKPTDGNASTSSS